MLLGRNCCEKCPITPDNEKKAYERLMNDVLFVGLQNRWSESVKAFHALYGGKVYREELLKRRASGRDRIKANAETVVKLYGNDDADTKLYQRALEIFELQIKKLNLTLPDWNILQGENELTMNYKTKREI